MIMRWQSVVFVPILFASSLTFASRQGRYDITGCGAGSVLFDGHANTHAELITESITNGSMGSQLFGISSDSSNCIDAHSLNASTKIKMYLEANRHSLENDIARGNGETIETLARLLECKGDKSDFNGEMIGRKLQKNYDAIFPNDAVSADQVRASIRSLLRSSPCRCDYLG